MTRLAACTGATQQRHDSVKPEPVVRTHATTGLVTVAHAKPMLAAASNAGGSGEGGNAHPLSLPNDLASCSNDLILILSKPCWGLKLLSAVHLQWYRPYCMSRHAFNY